MKLTTAFLLGVAVAAAAAIAGCGAGTTAPAPSSSPAGVTSSLVASGATQPTPTGSAATEDNPPGDIPDNQAYVEFSQAGSGVAVKVPEGWARSAAGSSAVFTDKLNRIEITVSTTGSAPTTASVTATDMLALQVSVAKFAEGKVTQTTRSAGPVILLAYQGDSAADPVTGKVVRDAFERYTYYRGGTRVDLTLSGPVNADNVDPWRMVSDSLRWTR